LEDAAQADLIIEAVPEKLQLKQQILHELESLTTGSFIFATNTSSLSITEIAKASRDPGCVAGMHFLNPVHIMRLVEIVVGNETAEKTVAAVREVGRRMRKETIVVRICPGLLPAAWV